MSVAEMRNVTVPIEAYAASHGRYPQTLEEASAPSVADPWGTPYRYEVAATRDAYTLSSAGPDRTWGTEDDLTYRRD